MPETDATAPSAPFKNLYLVRLGLGLSSALVFAMTLFIAKGTGSAFTLLVGLGGGVMIAAYAVDPWPLSQKVFSGDASVPRGPQAAWATRLTILAALLMSSAFAVRIFA